MLFLSYYQSNMAKCHFRKIDRKCQIFCVTSLKAQYAYNQWQIMKIQQVATCMLHLNNDLFLYAFVDCSTNIEVMIMELLEYMAVRSKLNCSLLYHLSRSLSKKRDLNDELTAWCTDQ